jgi:hypothetical protein
MRRGGDMAKELAATIGAIGTTPRPLRNRVAGLREAALHRFGRDCSPADFDRRLPLLPA